MRFGLDIVFVALMILFAVSGWRKGFIRACADFLGAVLAMIGAAILSAPAAQWVYDTFFHTALTEKIAVSITGLGASDAVRTVFGSFPEVIRRGLLAAGITEGSVMAQLQGSTLDVAESITLAISPMLVNFIRVLAMLVLFVVLLVLIHGIATLLNGLFELPILKGLNRMLGVVFGILLAVVVIWVALASVQSLLPLMKPEWQNRISQALDSSMFFSVLYAFNPAYTLIG